MRMTTYEPNPEDVSIEHITPDDALEYLKVNEGNRGIKTRKLTAFIRDMKSRDWLWNGETIKFDRDGKLIDGQHRLKAIVESGQPQWMLVVYNVERDAQSTIDTGTARTFGDTLRMRGYRDANLLAGTARMLWLWETGERNFRSSRHTPSIAELSRVIEEHPKLPDLARKARILTQNTVLTPSVCGLTMYLLSELNSDDAEDFFTKLRTGADLPEDHPVLALRRALERLSGTSRGNTAYMLDMQIAYVFKAWNRYRAGLPVKFLRFAPGGSSPEPFPEPI